MVLAFFLYRGIINHVLIPIIEKEAQIWKRFYPTWINGLQPQHGG
jgi:hypothetical protein